MTCINLCHTQHITTQIVCLITQIESIVKSTGYVTVSTVLIAMSTAAHA